MSNLEALIYDLKQLNLEKMTCMEFREKYLDISGDFDWKDVPDIVGNISHYIADEDLRRKNESYNKMQKNELQKLISLLSSDPYSEEINNISFLGES